MSKEDNISLSFTSQSVFLGDKIGPNSFFKFWTVDKSLQALKVLSVQFYNVNMFPRS